jgi:endonuclease YncB( thermonuclease family)
MRSRSRKSLLPVVALALLAGYFARGRSTTDVAPNPSAPSVARPVPRQPEPPVRVVKQEKASDSPRGVSAHHREQRQVHLRIVGVHDGDTITGLGESKTQFKIRLDAIDAPELGQPFGQASKKALSEKVFGKDVAVIAKTTDRYGRTVGHVLIDGRDVNLEMLEEGMAWHYKKYDKNKRLGEAEESARAARKGLWQDRDPVPPWDWRKDRKDRRAGAK